MQALVDELVVEPRHLGPRARRRMGWLVALVPALALLGGAGPAPGCGQTVSPVASPPADLAPLTADDQLVRNLHFADLDRARTTADDVAADVMPADVRRTTRRVEVIDGVSVYLASGPDFVCLGADGRPAYRPATPVCVLSSTVANHGLSTRVSSDGFEAGILVVAVPDGAELLTAASTERLADGGSVAVLRPGQDQVLLRLGGRPPIPLNDTVDDSRVRCAEG